MANPNNVLDETKKVLELMEESDEKISLLQQELNQTENIYEQIKIELNELQNIKTTSSADLEENQNFKSNIKDYNEKLVNLAQQIYSCGQQLYMEVNLRETELDEIGKMFNRNEEKYLEKLNKQTIEDEALKTKLEFINKENIEEDERKKLESKGLIAENEDLKNELEGLHDEIKRCKCYIDENTIQDEDIKYKDEITILKECLKSTNTDIVQVTELLAETENSRVESEAESNNYISEMNKKIVEIENEINIRSKNLEENKIQYHKVLDNIRIRNIECDEKEKEYEKHKGLLKEIEVNIKENEETVKKQIVLCEKSTLEYEEMRKFQKELNSKLKMEESLFRTKAEAVDEEVKKIIIDVQNLNAKISKVDLNKELELKQAELKQLKSTRHELKEIYSIKFAEIQAETKKLQREIEDIELQNKTLQEQIDMVEREVKQMRDSKDDKMNEKVKEDEASKQLEIQIQNLTQELARVKSEAVVKIKRKVVSDSKVVTAPKHLASSSTVEKKLKLQRHWDSDSSVEGEDRRFLEMAKQKIRMRKLQGNKS